jgi:protein-disulfide isomerase
MNHGRSRNLAGSIASCFLAVALSPSAQEHVTPAVSQSDPSIQRQIEALKDGQERILKELAEIRRLLQEKSSNTAWTNASNAPVISVNVHGEPFRGAIGARVAILEYSDFECSFCARYAREVFPLLDRNYIQNRKIKYFFRDLPAPGETNAVLKARAARCAGEQGRFWELHDRLFAMQDQPGSYDLTAQAQALGLDTNKFSACLASDRYSDSIRMSIAAARRAGVYGTPAFLIGTLSEDGNFMRVSKVLVGGESLDPIKSALDELLAVPPKN